MMLHATAGVVSLTIIIQYEKTVIGLCPTPDNHSDNTRSRGMPPTYPGREQERL